jgi:hypothetical protein
MLGKTKTGRGFSGTIYYCLQEKKNPEILSSNNIANRNKKGIIKELVALSSTNIDVSKPVWHSSLSFPIADNITDSLMIELANKFMAKAGFDEQNNQWIIIKHNDTPSHPHIHIVANRVGFDGRTVSDYYFKSKTVQWAKELEAEYGLIKVQEIAKKNQLDKRLKKEKQELNSLITKNLIGKKFNSLGEFQVLLEKLGVKLVLSRYQSNNKIFGVSYMYNSKTYKGSELSKGLAFNQLSKLVPFNTQNPSKHSYREKKNYRNRDFDLEL